MFNDTKELVDNILTNNPNSIYTSGKYYITDINNYEYLNYKSFFDDILLFIGLRYIFFYLNMFYKYIFKKECIIKFPDFVAAQVFIFKIRKGYFKDWINLFKSSDSKALNIFFPIIEINPFIELYDFMLNLIEIRIILLIVIQLL